MGAVIALERAWLTLRRRSAEERGGATGRRLAAYLGRRRGIYTKVGQMLAMRADLLSDEVRSALRTLEEDAPARSFVDVRRAIEASLGARVSEVEHVEATPLGTASVAQVHRATLRSGADVALKVRHAELAPEALERDLRALGPWLRTALRGLGSRSATELVDEVSRTLRDEVDFEREARVAEEVAAAFAEDDRIVVPRVHREACGPGLLALAYVPPLRLDEPDTLRARGIDPPACARLVIDAYARQVFGRGSFHADPHAGNVFAVDEPARAAGPRILFVDFGLSRRLEPGLRQALRRGLRALLVRDEEGLLAELGTIGAVLPGREAAARRALRAALGAGAHRALSLERSGVESLVDLGKRLVRESRAFRVPAELVLYARTLAHVLELTRRIDPATDPIRHLAPHALRFLAE